MTEVTDLHVPVMLERCLELLRPAISGKPATVIDATLGLGGHTEALLREHPELTVIGIDRDPEYVAIAQARIAHAAAQGVITVERVVTTETYTRQTVTERVTVRPEQRRLF
jgi:16S rRNA C1402 N4-methylase RsmH